MPNFLSYFKSNTLELYFSLLPQEKHALQKYGAHHLMRPSDPKNFSPKNLCQYLWTSAANIIPQGHYALAKKLLQEAIKLADNDQEKGHIYSNLAQIYADVGSVENCIEHCEKTVATGYFIPWAESLKTKMLMQA